MGEFESRSVKTRDVVEGFYLLENSYKLGRVFLPGYDGTENMFYFFYKTIFRLTMRKTIYEARMHTCTLISFIKL